MDFVFSEDQDMLRDSVRKWADKEYSFDHRRKVEQAGGVSASDWQALANLGLCGLAVPEAQGGAGFGPQEAMVVMEEMGRALVMEPFAHVALVATSILREAQTQPAVAPIAEKALGGIASGSAKIVLAYQERALRYQFDAPACKAEQLESKWALTGSKSLVAQASEAKGFIVSAGIAPSGEIALFFVEPGQGVKASQYQQQDASNAGELTLSGASAQLLLRGEPARQALARAIDVGIAAVSAEAVGAMEKMLALTIDYLSTRKQFGVPIGTFQSLRHRVADAKMHLELARSMSYFVTLKLNEQGAERSYAASQAKYQIGQSARWLAQQCVQMHGGIAVTDEYIASHYFKRLTVIDLQFGDSYHHLGIVSASMKETAGVFA